ncbi:MAG TPA: hypothetical protein VK139_08125 [Microbacteriaceae bacterium]|nr:hypothetical protein [Microbacteriaceae bacterium]
MSVEEGKPMTAMPTSSGRAFQRSAARTIGASGAAIALGGSLMFSAPALASTSCPDGATLLSNGSCQVVFTEDATYTPVAGASNIEALLVGGGGASDGFYGGGGGDVRIVDLAATGEITVVVGAGGSYADGGSGDGGASSVEQGGTTESAEGGLAPRGWGGASGSGIAGAGYAGSGAGGGGNDGDGGAGIEVASLDSTHFTDSEDCYGGGGAGYTNFTDSAATCGGGYMVNIVLNQDDPDVLNQWLANTGSADLYAPVENSGGGGTRGFTFDTTAANSVAFGTDGAAGLVELRFDYTAPSTATPAALATTGSPALPLGTLALGLGLTGVSLALARRARRS